MSSTISSNGAQAELLPSDKPVYTTPAEVMRALSKGEIDAEHADEIIAAMFKAASSKPKASPPSRKTECPISRAQFASDAVALSATIAGSKVAVDVKQFATGSFGWYANGKLVVEVGGQPVTCQLGLTLTVIGSKELAD